MSEADMEVIANGQEAQAEENGVKLAESKTETATAPEPEVRESTEQNGEENKSGERPRDNIDEKIDRYARETKRPFQKKGRAVRSNFENLPETDDPEEIRRQVEFYFSDANLHQDAFLLKETGGSKNRPFPLKQLHTFKRMRRFQPYSALLAAVKDSKALDVNDKDEITRKNPLSDDYSPDDTQENKRIYEEKSMARSVYAKGFGAETETTQTDIEEFFASYGDVSAVRLRRHHGDHNRQAGDFKGSALVEFADEQTAKSFLELDPKPKWQDKQDLEFRTKKDWSEEKKKQEADRPRRDHDNKRKSGDRKEGHGDNRRGGRGNKRGRGGRGGGRRDRSRDRDDDDEGDWRDRRDREQRGGRGRGGRGDDRRSDRDMKDEDGDREEKAIKDEAAAPDADDKVAELSKKRSRDDAESAAEPEAKKVKEDQPEGQPTA